MFFLWFPMYWAYLSFIVLGELGVWYLFIVPKVIGGFLIDLGV